MPNSILSSILKEGQFRAYDNRSGDQIWKSLGVLDVMVNSSAATSTKPLSNIQLSEDGTFNKIQGTDVESSKIIRPSQLKVVAIVPDITTAEAIINAWSNTFLTINIITRGIIADNMSLSNVEFEQTPEIVSAQVVTLEFDQVAVPSISEFTPAQSADASVYGIKIQTQATVRDNVTSILGRVNQLIGGLF